ncbi:leucyl aminopeptidase [Methylocapsa sp. S129]|uniref:leucyl aminopeptidase n=1 Tax=Methylocapsa sp. S129 TaxID=1641869 RepID=UPI00131CD9BA|nr:leucyl aminopeptidase [Methylocapsa sp. S129]
MSEFVKTVFGPLAAPKSGTCIVFVGVGLKCGPAVSAFLGGAVELIASAAKTAQFEGKSLSVLDILAPREFAAERLVVIGLGGAKELAETDFTALGGFAFSKIGAAKEVSIGFEPPEGTWDAAAAADFMMGVQLRAYRFDKYKKKKDDDKRSVALVSIGVNDVEGVRLAAKSREALVAGVEIARDLVNEPPNILFPIEFANRAASLAKLGVEIDVLDEKAMAKLGMGSLLGVGQGSARDSRLVVMRWNGAKGKAKKSAPVAFVGKGVCFDTGGISIKPAAGMEDMKGDMAGAACVVGLMHALASRKAKVNAVGAIGLVENMPDGAAIRPGDILTSMSGQTIEIINTDAEGRLVLADALWYIQDKYKPAFMVDLATLTGAILVALGQEYAGLFSNNDELATHLTQAGLATGEKVWRMPLGAVYDKMIDSKFADVKNAAGRHGGSITAAQFLQRFVNGAPWAHLDIAGVGMGSPASEINQSWGSGWGVRLLDRLVADYYEK